MSNTISLTQTLDDRQYVTALQKQYQLMEKMEKRLDGVAKAAKKAGDDGKKSVDGCAESIGSAIEKTAGWAAGLLSISSGFNLVVTANKAAREEAEKLGREYDALINKVATLGNMSALQKEETQKTLMGVAHELSWTKEQATASALALMGAGGTEISPEEAAGPMNLALGKMIAASGELDADPRTIATNSVNYLKATGQPLTGESLMAMGKRAVALDNTNFTLANIPDIAKVAGGMTRLTPEEHFGYQATLQDLYPTGAEAATAFRSVYSSMTTKGNSKSVQNAMKRLGVKPEDSDILGEDFDAALGAYEKAYNAAPAESRDNDMADIFGTENVGAMLFLMRNRKKSRANLEAQKHTEAFDSKVEIATSGRNAGERRMDLELGELRVKQDEQDDLVAKQREILFLKQGEPAAHNAINAAGYSAMRSLGVSQRTAHGMFSPMNISFDDVTKAMNENTRALDKNTQLMQQERGAPTSPVAQQGRKE